jgi:succinate-semialdehyde dehydrogenase / glutarate-semialdehyde dehydrogenase
MTDTAIRTLPAFSFERHAAADGASRSFPVVNPATEQPLIHLADATVQDALTVLEEAKRAAAGWAATPARERSDVLIRTFTLMMERREELAELISLENGKSRADALAEVSYAAEYFRWYAEEAVRLRGELFDNPTGTAKVLVSYEPVGVSLLVTPWNFPAAMATRKIGPAVAAGCTAILKPAAETPLTAIAIAEILREAGLPDGVLGPVVTKDARNTVAALMRDEAVRLISFTGSTEVGRKLMAQASDSVMRSAMELGGNAPFLVLDDAVLGDAVDGALLAKMRNGGQACTAANRFYVQSSIHDDFVAELVRRMGEITLGDPADEGTMCGPLVNRESVEKVQELVDDAVARGAKVQLGGSAPEGTGFYYPPTVLTDVPADARIMHEEVFGPVAPVAKFDSADEALASANATIHGLVSYLYTSDLAEGLRLSARLEAGMVALNRGLVSDPAAPFGGVKESGIGREGSHEGLLEYVEAKYVATNW